MLFERQILSSMLSHNDNFDYALENLRPHHFANEITRNIFVNLKEISKKCGHCNLATLITHLLDKKEMDKCGGTEYVTELDLVMTSKASFLVQVMQMTYNRRKLHTACLNASHDCLKDDSDLSSIGSDISQLFVEILSETPDHRTKSLGELIKGENDMGIPFMEIIEKRQQSYNLGIKLLGIPTGYKMLDDIIGGLQKKHYTILAGYSGTGKTTLALQMMLHILKQNIPIGFLSLEMSTDQVAEKLLIMEAGILEKDLRDGNIKDYDFQRCFCASKKLEEYPLYIEDRSNMQIELLGPKVGQMIQKYGIKVLFIDYIGELKTKKKFISPCNCARSKPRRICSHNKETGGMEVEAFVCSRENQESLDSEALISRSNRRIREAVKNHSQGNSPNFTLLSDNTTKELNKLINVDLV